MSPSKPLLCFQRCSPDDGSIYQKQRRRRQQQQQQPKPGKGRRHWLLCTYNMTDSVGHGERVMNSLANRILQLDGIIESHEEQSESTHDFVERLRNQNTVRKTTSDVNKFSSWLQSKNETKAIEDLTASELDTYLARFFMTVVKNDGSEYEPDTLKSIQGSLNRFLKQKGKALDLIDGSEFFHSREVLASKRKSLRQQGKGNRSNAAEPLTQEEINILYAKNLLGKGNPQAFINTMYLNNTMHFGMRSREEHGKLRWGDVELKYTATGERCLELTERATKTRNGFTGGVRAFPPKMYEDKENPNCPVSMYISYMEKRPPTMMNDNDPFYLGVHKKSINGMWYIAQPMGENTLGSLVKDMCQRADIQGRKVNHSARKTGITTLVHAGVPPTLVQQHSGHKNIASINNYSKASEQQQKAMSSIICNYSSTHSKRFKQFNSFSDINTNFSFPDDGADDILCRSSQELDSRSSQEMVENILNDIENLRSSKSVMVMRNTIVKCPLL